MATIVHFATHTEEMEDRRILSDNIVRDSIKLKTSERVSWSTLRKMRPVPQWNDQHSHEPGFYLDFIKPKHVSRLVWELEAEYTPYKGGHTWRFSMPAATQAFYVPFANTPGWYRNQFETPPDITLGRWEAVSGLMTYDGQCQWTGGPVASLQPADALGDAAVYSPGGPYVPPVVSAGTPPHELLSAHDTVMLKRSTVDGRAVWVAGFPYPISGGFAYPVPLDFYQLQAEQFTCSGTNVFARNDAAWPGQYVDLFPASITFTRVSGQAPPQLLRFTNETP